MTREELVLKIKDFIRAESQKGAEITLPEYFINGAGQERERPTVVSPENLEEALKKDFERAEIFNKNGYYIEIIYSALVKGRFELKVVICNDNKDCPLAVENSGYGHIVYEREVSTDTMYLATVRAVRVGREFDYHRLLAMVTAIADYMETKAQ